jgi:hypothetical protein
VFVHLCETFLGIPSSFTLFCYLFKLKPHPSVAKPSVLGGTEIQFHLVKNKSTLITLW